MSNEKEIKLHTTDRSLIDGAKTGDGMVKLTPDLIKAIQESLNDRQKHIDETHGKLVAECPYETKLAITAWVMSNIVDHAKDGGSFRYLIYDRLGFGPDAYFPLYQAGGMTISNEFDLTGEKKEDAQS